MVLFHADADPSFSGNQQQRRQALELQDLLAREPGRLGDAATIAEFASTAVSAVHDYISR